MGPNPTQSLAPGPVADLSPEFVARLAEQFAPVLVFHPDEQYFPTSPLFALENAAGVIEQFDADTAVEQLGMPEARIARYRALTPREKAGLATVYYRAYRGRSDTDQVVVLEYWLYYVENAYRIRGNPFPFWLNADHPNDLEHIHIVLRAPNPDPAGRNDSTYASESRFTVETVYASAHEGSMPAHRYRYPGEGYSGHTRFLVELGSHAMAPDVDEDGAFTPGRDGISGEKMLWGIRDRGALWVDYQPGYMEPRSEAHSWLLAHSASTGTRAQTPLEDRRLAYRLVPVQSLADGFSRLALSSRQREFAFENRKTFFSRVFAFRRLFGKDNGSSEGLLVPPPPPVNNDSIGALRLSSNESGILFGPTFGFEEDGLVLGIRHTFLHSNWYIPDFVVQLDGILTREKRYLASQFLMSYPIHAQARAIGGREFITDSISFQRRQWNWILGLEVRMGQMRILAAAQTSGPVSRLTKELRVTYLF